MGRTALRLRARSCRPSPLPPYSGPLDRLWINAIRDCYRAGRLLHRPGTFNPRPAHSLPQFGTLPGGERCSALVDQAYPGRQTSRTETLFQPEAGWSRSRARDFARPLPFGISGRTSKDPSSISSLASMQALELTPRADAAFPLVLRSRGAYPDFQISRRLCRRIARPRTDSARRL
jgi:hypothetical protein